MSKSKKEGPKQKDEGSFFSKIGSFFGGEEKKSPNSIDFPAQEKELVPDNVINFPSRQGTERVTPTIDQMGAPRRATMPLSVEPEVRREVNDENFQAVIDELSDMKKALVKAIETSSENQNVQVQIKGDMARFMSVLNRKQRGRAGELGIGQAVNR
jgi:hypothetical protein